jgi:hypothetical protein
MTAETGSAGVLRRKSAETWAFVRPRKNLTFSFRFKTPIILTLRYQRAVNGGGAVFASHGARTDGDGAWLPESRRRLYRDPAGAIV